MTASPFSGLITSLRRVSIALKYNVTASGSLVELKKYDQDKVRQARLEIQRAINLLKSIK